MTVRYKAIVGRRAQAAMRLLTAGGVALALAGCMESKVAHNEFAPDYRLRHPITLKEGDRTVEVFLGRNRGGLTPSQRADVLAFAQIWKREAMSGIIVDVPRGGATDHAASDSMREIHSIFSASGVPRNAVFVRPYRPPGSALASIKMNYSKLVAAAGPCGKWPSDLGISPGSRYTENQTYWNFGCANQRNLAAMVDNPADLVQPRGEGPAYAGRRSVAIDKYRKGEPPSGKYDGYDSGKISEVGR